MEYEQMYIQARGGLGNRLNVVAQALTVNRKVKWVEPGCVSYSKVFLLDDMSDIFDYDGLTQDDTEYWLFPGINKHKIGTVDHYPMHESLIDNEINSVVWNSPSVGGVWAPDLANKLTFRTKRIPGLYDIGITLRLLHPHFSAPSREMLQEIVRKLNELSDAGISIFLSTDKRLLGISDEIHYTCPDILTDNSGFGDPRTYSIAPSVAAELGLVAWEQLRNCKTIYRNNIGSTFTHWQCFVDGIQHKRIDDLLLLDADKIRRVL